MTGRPPREAKETAKRKILEALVATGGNVRRASAIAGYSRRHIYRMIKSMGLCQAVNALRREQAAINPRTSLDRLIKGPYDE